ncbi:MAG: hypothetical protein HWN66_01985 [Candidatus Helarchaeota archaeon]|nr:hypothetical protein [Candidatus Helarchaeota archaeon]
MAMGGGMIALNLITQFVVYGYLLGTARYRGGLLVGLAGLLVLLIEEGKLEWSASKFVLLVGSSIAITMSILTFTIVWAIFGIALCVLLILAIFDVAIPNEWWLSLMIGSAIFVLIHWVSGMVILVGFLLVLQDK